MEGLIGISKVDSGGLSTVTIKDFKTQYCKKSLKSQEETEISLSSYPGLILVFDGAPAWACDAILKSADGLTLIKSTPLSQITIDNDGSLAIAGKVNLYLSELSTLRIKNNRDKHASIFLRFIPVG